MTTTTHMTRHRSGTLDSTARVPYIALRLAAPEREEALSCAYAEGRTAGNFARLVYLMGRDVYRSQGYLAVPAGTAQPNPGRFGMRSGLVNEKPIALRLTPEELREANALAAGEDRTLTNMARVLFHMGMAVYRKHGRIQLPTAPTVSSAIRVI